MRKYDVITTFVYLRLAITLDNGMSCFTKVERISAFQIFTRGKRKQVIYEYDRAALWQRY